MSSVVIAARLFGGLALLFSNAFFVSIEFAMTRVRQFPESEFTGSRGLERAWEMTDRLEIYLSGCQVGITISSVGLGVVAEPAVAALFGNLTAALGYGGGAAGHSALSIVLALALINILHVVIGEQVPTYFGVERTKTAARWGAPVLYWWTRVMAPVIILADKTAKFLLGLFGISISRSWTEEEVEAPPTSRGEVRRQMGATLAQAGLTEERQQEVMNALEIGETAVSEVMVDAADIVGLYAEDPLDENLDRIRSSPHVRFPLFGESKSDFLGIIYTPAVLNNLDELETGAADLTDVAAPPMVLAPDTSVSDAIDQFQAENQELALVLSGGETVGLLTTTDAFEAIAGELEDPMDRRLDV